MRKSISWILEYTCKLAPGEQVKCLQANDNSAIRTILKSIYDPQAIWALPEGSPPYTPCEFPHQEAMLYQEARRLYLFIEGGNVNLTPLRRETMFVELLQTVDPMDAKLLLAAKEKTLPWKGLKAATVLQAYPGLF
jgi:hypothetical protein